MKRISALLALSFLCVFSLTPHKAIAQVPASGCGQSVDTTQVSTLVQPPVEEPNVYVRAGLPEDQVAATLYFQALSIDSAAPCITIGSVTLTAEWQKIGVLPNNILGVQGSYAMTLHGEGSGFSASGPQLLFTPMVLPCALAKDCIVSYKGSSFDLSPKKISSPTDSLRAGSLQSFDTDSIKQVIYSVDGVQAYTKKTIEPFNDQYVAGGDHSVERTIVLASGQSLTDKRTIQKGTLGNVTYLFTSAYSRYSRLLFYVGVFAGLYVSWLLFVLFARFMHRRRLWKANHIAGGKSSFDASKAGPQDSSKFEDSPLDIIKNHKKLVMLPVACIILLFISYSFILSSFTVDGVSMYPTLHDKTKHPLFVLPEELGKISGNGYTPARGTIVVVQKDDNNLFNDSAVKQKSYVVKRVLGLPEERVHIKDGKIYIYNKQHPDGFVPDDEFKWFKKTDYAEYAHLDLTLKQGELFVAGDNRGESIDSRFYGPIRASQIVGRVL